METTDDPITAYPDRGRRPELPFATKSRVTTTGELLGLLAVTAVAASLVFGVLFAGVLLQVFRSR